MTELNCDESIEYLKNLKGGSINPGLERIENLLGLMGDPQKSLRFIHIAGTNGKGSTLAFTASVLYEAGYRVGTYTSPAVFSYRERYRIGKRDISKSDLVRGVSEIRRAVAEMEENGMDTPSSFEAETALAFWYFREKNCDIAVIETGMGGLEDATNVIPAPLAAVIVSIGYDHMSFLGDTLEKIAFHKAGIIKPGCTVISAAQRPGVGDVIENAAAAKGCKLRTVDPELIKDRRISKDSFCQVFDYGLYKKLRISLAGKYQLMNAAVCVETVLVLRDSGIKISDRALYDGLEKAVWPGRFQKISDSPRIIIDGAHNEDAALRLSESIDFYFTNRNIIYIMGMLRDKECDRVCEITAGRAGCIFTVSTPPGPRSLSSIELAEIVRRYNKNVTAADSIDEALEMARAVAGNDGVIIVFGSLSFLGKVHV